MLHFRQHILFTLSLFLLLGGSAFAQDISQDISIDRDKSRLWIEGSSNVNQFSCRAEHYNTSITQPRTLDEQLGVEVDIAVSGFECGKRRMNRDLNEALKSEDFPTISFDYKETRSMSYDDSIDQYVLTVVGYLTVAGHRKEIEFPMKATALEDGTLQATGETELRMTDYNVEPPTALLGLVRVEDRLTVHFELYANTQTSDPFDDAQY